MIWSNIMFAKPLRRLQKHYFRSSYRERLFGILFFTLQVPLRSRFRARNGNECGRYIDKASTKSSSSVLPLLFDGDSLQVPKYASTPRRCIGVSRSRVGCAEAFFCEFEPPSRASSSCFSQCGPAAAGHFRTILRPLDV